MRILGVDPGTLRTGVGIVESQANRYKLVHAEVISVKGNIVLSKRLYLIYQSLSEIIRIYQPKVLALENIFFGKDVQAMVKIGEARACAMLAATQQGVEVKEYSPARVKQSVAGNGRATKGQIQHMMKTLLNLKETPEPDSADALAVAICHIHSTSAVIVRVRSIRSNLRPTQIASSRLKTGRLMDSHECRRRCAGLRRPPWNQ